MPGEQRANLPDAPPSNYMLTISCLAAHASARPPEHSEATVDPRGSVQPEFDPAQADGGGHAAGMDQPPGPSSFLVEKLGLIVS
jgi:hypothetical protein